MDRRVKDEAYMRAKGWSEVPFGSSNPAVERLFLALRKRFFPPAGTAIEIGFGGGALLDFLKRSGYRVRGYEISEPLVELARAHGFDAFPASHFSGADRGERGADLIVSIDVFEHMDDAVAVATLQSAAHQLAPDGVIVIRTPNAASPLGVHYQYSDWTHVNFWSAPYAAYCAERANLKLTEVVGEFDFSPAPRIVGVVFAIRNALFKATEKFLAKSTYRAGGFRLSPNLYFVFRKRETGSRP